MRVLVIEDDSELAEAVAIRLRGVRIAGANPKGRP
jgi:hypothetical protein